MPLLHAGGEILTCDAWQAMVMLLDADEAIRIVGRLAAKPRERDEWAQRALRHALHIDDAAVPHAPYVVRRALLPGIGGVAFASVGGVELGSADPALRDEVLQALRSAAQVSVRDEVTRARLLEGGVDVVLAPDPVTMISSLFGEGIGSRETTSIEVARVRDAFPDGWLSVQFGADFGDDETLATIAAELDGVGRDTALGFALFRAGAAPWHDTLDVLERIAARMSAPTLVFRSLNVWDICALIAGSRGFCGSSLHGRIVASAFGIARVNVSHPSTSDDTTKQHAYAATWESATQPGVVSVQAIGEGIRAALSVDSRSREDDARALAVRFRESFESLRKSLQRR